MSWICLVTHADQCIADVWQYVGWRAAANSTVTDVVLSRHACEGKSRLSRLRVLESWSFSSSSGSGDNFF